MDEMWKISLMSPIDIIKRNAVDLISKEELLVRLSQDRPLRIKFGVDPTRPDLTFGHLVQLNKLREFQQLGHQVILIIGDFTTLVGDPSGLTATRPVLAKAEVDENAGTYLDQAFRILLAKRTTVRHNSEWFDQLGFQDALSLARKMTVARMLERDDFATRYRKNNPISIVEFLYPLLQGYDSVVVEADLELGGTDQLFNLLVGRNLQREAGQTEQVVLTMPLLVGLDGRKKMSKSLDNYIAFNDSPKDMFGKIMSLRDDMMWDYFRLLLGTDEEEIQELGHEHPMQVKRRLALQLTAELFDRETADNALEQFDKVFSRREQPDELTNFSWNQLAGAERARIIDLLASTGLFQSNRAARRLIEQGAVKVDGERVADPNFEVGKPSGEIVIQAGKRTFFRILPD